MEKSIIATVTVKYQVQIITKVVPRLKQKGGAGLKSDNKLHNGMVDTSGVTSTTNNNMHYAHFQ